MNLDFMKERSFLAKAVGTVVTLLGTLKLMVVNGSRAMTEAECTSGCMLLCVGAAILICVFTGEGES